MEDALLKKCLKQCAVAEKTGIVPDLFSAMLNERKVIIAEHLPHIAYALRCEVNELYKEVGE